MITLLSQAFIVHCPEKIDILEGKQAGRGAEAPWIPAGSNSDAVTTPLVC